jgi:Fe-S oxidoreductase
MYETLDLCVGCKGCKRECPTGVDVARMKIEFLAHYKARHGHTLTDRLIAHLPDYAGAASRVPWLINLRDRLPGAAWASEKLLGLSASAPAAWRRDTFSRGAGAATASQTSDRRSGRGQGGAAVRRHVTFGRERARRPCLTPQATPARGRKTGASTAAAAPASPRQRSERRKRAR